MRHIIPVRKIDQLLMALVGLLVLSACTQMPKHGNMLIFGTNTSYGVNVGKDASQTPTAQIGFIRQEVALIPLLAHTAAEGQKGDLIPCPSATVIKKQTPEDIKIENLKDCKFVAIDNGNQDSYSTLASFGAKTLFGSGDTRLAQYFATGIAAQRLTETGGANLVLAGKEASISAVADATKAAVNARKVEALAQYNLGRQVALKILGNDEEAKLDSEGIQSKLKSLEAIMGNGCDRDTLKSRYILDGLAAGTYLDLLMKRRPFCFDNLIP